MSEFRWLGHSNFFLVADTVIPADVIDMSLPPDNSEGWCAEMAIGESGILLDLYGGTEEPEWITLVSPILEEKYGHHLRIRPVENQLILVEEWGVTMDERFVNMIFEQWTPRVTPEQFLDWRRRLQRMEIRIDPNVTYWKPKSG